MAKDRTPEDDSLREFRTDNYEGKVETHASVWHYSTSMNYINLSMCQNDHYRRTTHDNTRSNATELPNVA